MPTETVAVPYAFHPEAWLLALFLGGGYLYLLSAWGPRHAPAHLRRTGYATRQQKVLYGLGVVVFFVGTAWPIHDIGEDFLYSFHMVQHMLYQFIAAPLLLLGVPAWLYRAILSTPRRLNVARTLTRAGYALVLVNAWVAVAHTVGFVELSVNNGLFHLATHVLWVVVGVLMWWPVLSPLPEVPHYSYFGRMAYLFSHSIVPTVPASFLTFSRQAFYPSYVDAPRVFASIDPVTDLQIAGLLMKIGGGLLLWSVIAILFFRWAAEDRDGGPDFLYWRDYAGTDQIPELTTT